MKRLIFILILALTLTGCAVQEPADVVATTKPVYDFVVFLCQGTDLEVSQLITENVSCLHDYALSVSQVRTIESADVIITSGAGLEAFMKDLLFGRDCVIDSAEGIALSECTQEHDHVHDHAHEHEEDAHIWLAPENARIMAENICKGLCDAYPEHVNLFHENLSALNGKLYALEQYAEQTLLTLSCRDLITFHDGFGYMARSFDLHILAAIEEESGSEASAKELIELIELIDRHEIPAIFVEANGSTSASRIIAAETDVAVFSLDMGMGERDYFETMYHNIDSLKEALG